MTTKPLENAFWIWDGDADPAAQNTYRYFRKAIRVPAHWPSETTLRICADARYKLFIDGIYASHGPAPSASGIYAYDEVPVRCRPGHPLVIGVIVNSVGEPMFYYHGNRPGLIAEIEDIVTDESWQVATVSPYDPSSARFSVQQGHAEVFDPAMEPLDWGKSGAGLEIHSPEQWKAATIVERAYGSTWPSFEPRGIPLVASRELPAPTLIDFGNCVRGGGESAAERITNDLLRPLTAGEVRTVEGDGGADLVVIPSGEDVFLTYDFGGEVSGHVIVAAQPMDDGARRGFIDIGYDEALRVGELAGEFRSFIPGGGLQHYGDTLRLTRASEMETFSPRAFRYLRLVIRDAQGPVRLISVGVAERTYPINNRGVFTCSDARLDRIWEIGRRTLQLCMEDRFMDCPSRERAQWVGDARIQAIGASYCFGDTLLHRRFLRQTALDQKPDGRLDPVGPGDWESFRPNTPIPGFMALFIESVLDYYVLSGDGGPIVEVLPAVQRALGYLASYGAGEGGLLSDAPGWNFTDWAPGLSDGPSGIAAPLNLFYVMALRASALLAEQLGDQAMASSNRARAGMVAAAFDSLFWNPLRGVYVDAVTNGEQSNTASQQVNTLVLLAGVGGEARRLSVISRLLSDTSLTQIGSPYFSYYLVEALAKVGRHQSALDAIRTHWGAMLDAGATSWWEDWTGNSSRCHAWSIAPTLWLPQQVLGVTAREPGFACVTVAPKPCDLTWAKGIVPLPAGDALVSWKRKDGRFTLDVTVPTGIHLRTILPCSRGDLLTVNGEPVADDAVIVRTDALAELAVLPGSGYRFEVVAG